MGTEPPHCGCAGAAGVLGASLPGSPRHRPGLMFTHAGPSLAVGVCQGEWGCRQPALAQGGPGCVPLQSQLLRGAGTGGLASPPARPGVPGDHHLGRTPAAARSRLWISRWGTPWLWGALVLGSTSSSCLCCSLQHNCCNGCSNCQHLPCGHGGMSPSLREGHPGLLSRGRVSWAPGEPELGGLGSGRRSEPPAQAPPAPGSCKPGRGCCAPCVPCPLMPLKTARMAVNLWAQQ